MTAPRPPVDCNHGAATFSRVHHNTKEADRRQKYPIALAQLRRVPRQCSGVEQRLVREHGIDRLSHEACALSLFLVTGADAQGLSSYADPSLWQRLFMPGTALPQARQALIRLGLVAYQRPLYQVLALDRDTRGPTAEPLPASGDEEPVDLKAVFKQIWEVVS
jgi:hypothetical protein